MRYLYMISSFGFYGFWIISLSSKVLNFPHFWEMMLY